MIGFKRNRKKNSLYDRVQGPRDGIECTLNPNFKKDEARRKTRYTMSRCCVPTPLSLSRVPCGGSPINKTLFPTPCRRRVCGAFVCWSCPCLFIPPTTRTPETSSSSSLARKGNKQPPLVLCDAPLHPNPVHISQMCSLLHGAVGWLALCHGDLPSTSSDTRQDLSKLVSRSTCCHVDNTKESRFETDMHGYHIVLDMLG